MKRENINFKGEEDAPNIVADAMGKLDELRLEELQKFQGIQSIKNEVLKKERQRLSKKSSDKHLRVTNIESRLQYNKGMFAALEKEIEKASIKQELFESTSWRVHGRVFEDKNKPVKGFTVFLADGNKSRTTTTGSACTNEKGYYSITLDDKALKELQKQPLFLAVANKDKKTVYLSKEPLTPKAGAIVFKDIPLNADECTPTDHIM